MSRITIEGLNKALGFLGKKANQVKNPGGLMRKIGLTVQSSTINKIKTGEFRGEKSLSALTLNNRRKKNGEPLKDTGAFMQSINSKLMNPHAVEIGSKLKYARLVTKGGTIRAKKSYLYIPANSETSALSRIIGVTKTIERYKRKGYSVWRTASCIMAKKGSKGEPFVLFILKKEVTVPSRDPFYLNKTDKKLIKKEIQDWLSKN